MPKEKKFKPGKLVVPRWWSVALLLAGLLLLVLAGCASPAEFMGVDRDFDEAPAMEHAPEPGMAEDLEDGRVGEVEAAEGQRYIIRNARLTMEIPDIDTAVQKLQEETERMNGYVSALDIYTISDERRAGSITLRIPVERFDLALEAIKGLGRTKNEQFDTDDVTRRYIDMEARLKNLEVQEQRLRELLDQAETIEDILKVESELGRIRGDLEAMQGEFRYLRERVRYSTFLVRLEERDPRTQVVADGGLSWEQLGETFILNTNRLIRSGFGFVIWFIGSLPILLPLGGLFFLGWKLLSNRRKKKLKRLEELQQQKEE